jgi:putative flavoprotein involved in K+ transport
MDQTLNVAIIGAGQAGLATSYFLKEANVDHVVLEAGRVAETWRSRRWDSFCLVTPNWSVRLPGAEYRAPDPDGFMGRDELVDYLQRWSESFEAPVREDCPVSALDLDGDGFLLTTPAGKLKARSVFVATGGYQRPHRPKGADQVPSRVNQLLAEDYDNEASLPEGAVLIVGGGQTGCQLAEELHQAGRRVILSCGRAPWAPRRFGGHDLVWWIVKSGFWNRTLAQLPFPAARLFSNPLATGHGGGHDLHYRTLHASGVELTGRFAGADDEKAYFDDDLARSLQAGDDLARVFAKWVAAFCEREGMDIPWEVPQAINLAGRKELDLDREGITTVIWSTGFRPDYHWVHADVFDDMGFPVLADGRSDVAGLYFMGVHFQRKAQSAVLYGVGEDAEIVAAHIKDSRA